MERRQPALHLLGGDAEVRTRRLLLAAAAALALTACGGSPSSAPPSPGASESATVPSPPPRPATGACHELTYDQAVAATAPSTTTSCHASHASETYAVGNLDVVVDGHLLAVTSARAQKQAATVCPARLHAFVGGSRDDLRLSMLRAVWFTPTSDEATAGASWYRCDVIVVAGDSQLADVTASLKGALDGARAADLAMCGTAAPGTSAFHRVLCREPHSWKAVDTVDISGSAYPGASTVKSAGTAHCKSVAQQSAANRLKFKWGYEWPTAAQWAVGQHYGICWAPGA